MATISRYVDPDAAVGGNGTTNALAGGNCAYTSINAWEAARQSDLVASGNIERAVCSSSGANHTADTISVTMYGWSTSVTCYPEIFVDPDSRHVGVWDDTKYRLTGSGNLIIAYASFTKITGLQFKAVASSGTNSGMVYAGNVEGKSGATIWVEKCIFSAEWTGTADGVGVHGATVNNYIWNCVAYDIINGVRYCCALEATGPGTNRIVNCTTVNCYHGIYNAHASNCIVQDCAEGFIATTTDGDYNISDLSGDTNNDAGGTHCHSPVDIVFADKTAHNYQLDSTDTYAIGGGYDYHDDATLSFSDDICGTARPNGEWDIGAFQHVVAAESATYSGRGIGRGISRGIMR